MEIISRQSWGAAAPKKAIGRISGSVGKLFLHHTVTRSGPADQEQSLMREIQKIAFSRGFSDISYSFIIFPGGQVYEGRGWGKVGAHTEGHNSTSYAISLAGNYENEPMTDAQVQAARGIIAEGQRLGHIAANFNIRGHREVKATACPGKNAFARLHEIRTPGQTNGGGTDANAFPLGPNEVFKRGTSGPDVCRIQERLRAHGHDIDRVNDCPFGPQTERAVKDFQRLMNLDVDGKVGENTWRALFA